MAGAGASSAGVGASSSATRTAPPSGTTRTAPPSGTTMAAALGLSGAVAGAVAKTAIAPLERLKLLAQTGQSTGGVLRSLSRVAQHDGFWSLWRGNSVNVARIIPNKCVLLACSDLYKDAVPFRQHLSSPAVGGVAGAMAGVSACLATYPLDLVRTRQAGFLSEATGRPASYAGGAWATLVAIRKEEGFLALYRGSLPTVLGALPYEGIKFGVYDFLRARLRAADGGGGSGGGPLSRACCGAAAGLIAHILTYPNDTLRRRLQLQGAGGKAPAYSGYFDCLSKLVRREGWPSLYRGLGITLVRTLPNTGIQFGVYEACKDYLRYVEYRNAR